METKYKHLLQGLVCLHDKALILLATKCRNMELDSYLIIPSLISWHCKIENRISTSKILMREDCRNTALYRKILESPDNAWKLHTLTKSQQSLIHTTNKAIYISLTEDPLEHTSTI